MDLTKSGNPLSLAVASGLEGGLALGRNLLLSEFPGQGRLAVYLRELDL